MTIWTTLVKTGGPPELRRQVWRLLDEAGVRHDANILSAKAVYRVMDDFVRSELSAGTNLLILCQCS